MDLILGIFSDDNEIIEYFHQARLKKAPKFRKITFRQKRKIRKRSLTDARDPHSASKFI